ncbi:penicillin-binding protein 2 [Candidatus Saccharibacteria bacterium]|nr:penicillin-binding protein 2 [Candidatus Saccharibacteria bacterium]
MPQSNSRIKILKNVTLLLFAVILVRLFFIQIVEHDAYLAKADEQHTLEKTITARRGEIYMMDGDEPVAVVLNQTRYQIVIDPTVTEKEDAKKVLETYAKEYKTADLDEVYGTENLRYAIIAKDVPRELAEEIAEADIPAIWLKKTNRRVYPEGEFASGLLGFVNDEGKGQYGVEGSLNEQLSGKDGLLKTTADVNKVALSIGNDNIKVPAEDGKNIILSIDRRLERRIEELALEAIDNTIATNASVLVMDPNTSKVLAMANLPNYNPDKYTEVANVDSFLNYTLEVPYEPASVCKTFTYSAAIEEGVMSPETTYFNKHFETIDGWQINNASKNDFLYGNVDMRRAFNWSLNTGSIHALKLLGGNPDSINQQGREKLYDYFYNKFHLGQFTGIELYEAAGLIQDPNEGWGRDSVYANMTFGQNLSITMLQTATAFSAAVNGGVWRTPSVVEGIYEDGEIKPFIKTEPVIEETILSEQTSATMRELLISNRSNIKRPGYDMGGKTGTGEVVREGAYTENFAELIGSYVGFIATEGELPKYVIMVKMWGEGKDVVASDAMDLFNSVSDYMINYYKIKPKE